jgi:hypothetical protein
MQIGAALMQWIPVEGMFVEEGSLSISNKEDKL